MSQKYFKPLKKYVSRKLAVQKLKVTPKQFDRLVVLCSVYPMQAVAKHCLDREEGWYYTIGDIKKIYYSDAYDVILKNKYNSMRREEYLKFGRSDKARCFVDEEFGLVDLIRGRYDCFGDSLADVGTSLRGLYFIKMLGMHGADNILEEFETFIVENKLIENAFLSRSGIFFSFNIEKIRIVWSVPYPAENLSGAIEEKRDVEKVLKFTALEFLDFDSSGEDDDIEEETVDHNDPSKLDVSLLAYAAPLLAMHVRLVVHKLKLLYGSGLHKKAGGIFGRKRICVMVKSIREQVELLIRSEGGLLATPEEAEIAIAESVDNICADVLYLQPQYIFDALNAGRPIDHEPYLVGKPLPPHKSPFPDILEALDARVLKTLSNTKRYQILDKLVQLS